MVGAEVVRRRDHHYSRALADARQERLVAQLRRDAQAGAADKVDDRPGRGRRRQPHPRLAHAPPRGRRPGFVRRSSERAADHSERASGGWLLLEHAGGGRERRAARVSAMHAAGGGRERRPAGGGWQGEEREEGDHHLCDPLEGAVSPRAKP
eukprot:5420283-Prymnesium_polylepis.1